MSSGFSGDYFSNRSQRPFTGQLPEPVPDPTSQILNRLPVITGKRSLAEFQAHKNQALSFYLRNVKSRINTPSILGYPVSRNTEIAPGFLNCSSLVQNRQNSQISPDFFSNAGLVPPNNHNRLQEAEYSISRQITHSNPYFLNNPNLVPNQNMLLQETELPPMLMQDNQNAPNFFNNSSLVLNQNILPEAEFLTSLRNSQNNQNTPNFLSYPNLVPNQNQKMMMNKLQELAFPLQKSFQNTPSLSTYSNSVPDHNQTNTTMAKLQELAFPPPNSPENTPELLNSSDSVPDPSAKMMNKLQELEKHLLDDDDEEGDTCSVVTNAAEWSDTWRNLVGPRHHPPSLSPTSSCSSCCSSPPSTLSLKQTLLEAATCIHDNRHDLAREILTRLSNGACAAATAEQRLANHFCHALMARLGPTRGSDPTRRFHVPCTDAALFELLPCFRLGFVAANLAILDATSASKRIHVIDFGIGRGGHYVHLIHVLAARNKEISLKITAAAVSVDDEASLGRIGDSLRSLATKVGISVAFATSSLKATDLTLERLGVEEDEDLAVNLPFNLNKLPDESVTTDNQRDEFLRRVKALSPTVVTVVEQEMNTNTAPFLSRVNETCDYYTALFESLDSIIPRDDSDRVKLEEGLGRKLVEVVACEGIDRVERCEVFGKWRARMGMAGFKPSPISRPIVESLMGRVGPGFTAKEESGGVLFGWMGRTLTVASAWQ